MDERSTVKVEVKIDRTLAELEDAGLDVSAETTRALKRALGPRPPANGRYAADAERATADEVAWYDQPIEEHGLFADGWQTF